MDDAPQPADGSDEVVTFLGVRPDGIASVVDLLPSDNIQDIRGRALWLLREHASCHLIEVWRDGILLERLDRD